MCLHVVYVYTMCSVYTLYHIPCTHVYSLDKFTSFAQDRDAWALLVSHTKHKTKQQWVQSDGGRGGREVPWSHTPVTRVRADDVRVPRRAEVVPRLLMFYKVEAEEEGE